MRGRLSLPGVAQRSGKRRGQVVRRQCIGCRYCTITCPYQIPKFQWMGFNPRVTKCELCSHRLDKGLKPGCSSVCPTGAVIFGPRSVLLLDAKQRIKNSPGRYYQNRVYGETDNGGTQALYLSHVRFEKLGRQWSAVGRHHELPVAEFLLSV